MSWEIAAQDKIDIDVADDSVRLVQIDGLGNETQIRVSWANVDDLILCLQAAKEQLAVDRGIRKPGEAQPLVEIG
jgi:hypothetical protein